MATTPRTLRIVHISDTHSLHRLIEPTFGPMPDGDILVHTGDFSNDGTDAEVADFDAWLGELRARYRHILLVVGNHEWRSDLTAALAASAAPSSSPPAADNSSTQRSARTAFLAPGYWQSRLRNARVLHNELVDIEGLKVYGAPWMPWHDSHCPENGASRRGHAGRTAAFELLGDAAPSPPHAYDAIPHGVHVLMTHGPALRILDCVGAGGTVRNWGPGGVDGATGLAYWGSSALLRARIERVRPDCHLFGHLHEQRGVFVKCLASSSPNLHAAFCDWTNQRGYGAAAQVAAAADPARPFYVGGVEYTTPHCSANPFVTFAAPDAASYPCVVISNNSMLNHVGIETRSPPKIAGPPRVILAMATTATAQGTAWTYTVLPPQPPVIDLNELPPATPSRAARLVKSKVPDLGAELGSLGLAGEKDNESSSSSSDDDHSSHQYGQQQAPRFVPGRK